ncbi:hypothetical protein ACFY05_00980 [Microtetraspora fusca]|uniref:Uncharacterized protein n=1 Tax=Microtetraspora fusca TaxID=1997 RepID=A0ABW6V078_MICFU
MEALIPVVITVIFFGIVGIMFYSIESESVANNAKVVHRLQMRRLEDVSEVLIRLESVLISHDGSIESVNLTTQYGTVEYSKLADLADEVENSKDRLIRIFISCLTRKHSRLTIDEIKIQLEELGEQDKPILIIQGYGARERTLHDLRQIVSRFAEVPPGDTENLIHTENQEEVVPELDNDRRDENRPTKRRLWHVIANQPLAVQIVGGVLATPIATLLVALIGLIIPG